ncbi:hypothetical protein G6F65_022520 [Rhizopus arrhizus]|nr:hypothetical protein G6F65_022520 [Rhizopus arrhizus]
MSSWQASLLTQIASSIKPIPNSAHRRSPRQPKAFTSSGCSNDRSIGVSNLLKKATPVCSPAPDPEGVRPPHREGLERPSTAYSWTWPCAVKTG